MTNICFTFVKNGKLRTIVRVVDEESISDIEAYIDNIALN